MDKELEGKLAEVIGHIQVAATKTADFALEQLPDIAQSYVVYGRAEATFFSAAFLALTATAAFVMLRFGFFSKAVNAYGNWTELRGLVAIFGSVVFVLTGALLLGQIPETLLVWLAPKVWLLRELAHLVK